MPGYFGSNGRFNTTISTNINPAPSSNICRLTPELLLIGLGGFDVLGKGIVLDTAVAGSSSEPITINGSGVGSICVCKNAINVSS